MRLTASLVLYNNPPAQVDEAIASFLGSSNARMLIVRDNSPVPIAIVHAGDPRVQVIHDGRNPGFGAAHNEAFAALAGATDVHLIMNPDVAFDRDVLPHLAAVMDGNPHVGAVMPQIRYPDGSLQHLCKLLETPFDLVVRRFGFGLAEKRNRLYELHDLPQNVQSPVPSLSGCFLLVRSSLFQSIGGFDERFFMYMEDRDLVRRIGDHAVTLYDPLVFVAHAYGKGSYRSTLLLKYHIQSAIRYFNKWGWFVDPIRRSRNRAMLALIAAGRGNAPDKRLAKSGLSR